MRESNQGNKRLTWVLAVVFAAVLGDVTAGAQTVATTSNEVPPVAAKAARQRLIVVSLLERKLVLLEDGAEKKVYTVAVGKASTPSPTGRFTIDARVSNPTYSHRGKVVGPGPGNPVGSRWMGLSVKGYGIHGTNEPQSIGKAASHGCIRMGKADLEELFAQVQVGDAVEIRAESDAVPAETASSILANAAEQIPADARGN